MLKTSAPRSRYGGQFTLSSQLIKPNYMSPKNVGEMGKSSKFMRGLVTLVGGWLYGWLLKFLYHDSAGGADVAVIFEGSTSTSGVCIAGGGSYFFRCLRFLQKTFPSSVRTVYECTSTWSSTWAFFHFQPCGLGSITTASPLHKGDSSWVWCSFLLRSFSHKPGIIEGFRRHVPVGKSILVLCPQSLGTGEQPTTSDGVFLQSNSAK